ncbi:MULTISPECIES: MFS transporter [Ramlibacter]|uniref:MFS transporter n=1 Tax=Ramlibacter pinisoli TaxID=2682844 RepID=A0A6N8IY68_9BURK|nr:MULTISPECIES: MFS transporter [Ramlibacter]MBA2961649.1 MFS transporter [Ramlibacter sp. CGMCC 1.13660]MVQ31592.1 MFS transporter [Ramlibacter pinisoli]
MTCPAATVDALPASVSRPRFTLSRPASFLLLGSITLSFLAGASAPTPLYPVYQRLWGFSAIEVAAVFASYAVVLLATLLVTGRLSDHIGRRPVVIAAALLQLVAMGVFAAADSVAALYAGRILQGIATGAAVAALGAGMLDFDPTRGTMANAVAPALGTATGALLSGLMVRYLPQPTHLVYALLAAVYLLQAVGVWLMPEPVRRRPGALASLRPRLAAPQATRGALRAAVPILVAGWSVAGFYASLVPALVRKTFGLDASLAGGVALFMLAGSAAVAVVLLRKASEQRLMTIGAAALLAGMAGVLAALEVESMAAFFAATVLTGIGFGSGFQGGVRAVLAPASAAERAGVLAVVFVVSYLSMGLPAVAAGFVAARSGNLLGTAIGFAAVVIALALLATVRATGAISALRARKVPSLRTRRERTA